ncbi:BZ3500_MvSof-1268-A1-R1_Chr10-1g02669 [Microbotryum saponariae]|uniref:Acyl-coenzyme A oxidase n=1 Tax=Microbotryum saponariae TaxID=289078 RepID=A0A2X0LLV1_9BASI|nr:BZ3500_MvSof-1268-A1-R1_Chr10-1g02669 [Microbotryum saponariae]SDA06158.1 BZ3501_MvSof-1269-A2-R1_Chr10-1g02270 [Microbotryum saponariae]
MPPTSPAPLVKAAPSPRETMSRERENCPFDVRRMTYAMGGGQKDVELKEMFMQDIERDPLFKLADIHDLTKNQIRERTMAKFATMVHYVLNERLDVFTKRMELVGIADPSFWTRYGVHYGLFLGAIRSAATPNQFSYWLEKGVLGLNGMVGCFGMTELAHGSNVAGLETTATFDETTDEFVIHTPSVSATKWWIGGAAQTATHCAVFAQLVIKGKMHGVKTFITPLRNPKTFALLPGVAIGDIGKKMGRDGIDNGWIQFTNVRIPRHYMLMKHTQVTRDGSVQEPPLAALTYGALLQGRTAMVADAANVSKKALVIAIRYAIVRRQFKSGNRDVETQIIDYPIHQRRLLPLLAQAVAMGFTALQMTTMFETLSGQLESLGPDSPPEETKEVLEKLKEVHATSAGLKAFCTWNGLETIEKCRASCGGHGYSAYTGLASMYNDQAVQCTWEGDNTILTLQAGRSLITAYADAKAGQTLPGGTAYLNRLPEILSRKCPSDDKALDADVLGEAWAVAAANSVKNAAERFEEYLAEGKEKDEAMELTSQERFVAAKVHTAGYIYRRFVDAIKELSATEDPSNGVVATLEKICRLYGAWSIEENAGQFLKYEFYTPKQMDRITAEVTSLCGELRHCAASLVDAFNYSDHIINSPLGVYSGDVYKVYFDRVRESNPHETVHPYFERIIKPLIEREPLEIVDADDVGLDEEIDEIREEREEAKKEAEQAKNQGVQKEIQEEVDNQRKD